MFYYMCSRSDQVSKRKLISVLSSPTGPRPSNAGTTTSTTTTTTATATTTAATTTTTAIECQYL